MVANPATGEVAKEMTRFSARARDSSAGCLLERELAAVGRGTSFYVLLFFSCLAKFRQPLGSIGIGSIEHPERA